MEDRSIKFLHAFVVDKNSRLTIHKINGDDGSWLEDLGHIKQAAKDFFPRFIHGGRFR